MYTFMLGDFIVALFAKLFYSNVPLTGERALIKKHYNFMAATYSPLKTGIIFINH